MLREFPWNPVPRLARCAAFAVAASCAAHAQPFAYVPNEGSGTVSVIDTKTDALVADIAVGGKPRGIAASPDGSRVFVSDQATSTLHVLRAKQRDEEAAIAVGESPEA